MAFDTPVAGLEINHTPTLGKIPQHEAAPASSSIKTLTVSCVHNEVSPTLGLIEVARVSLTAEFDSKAATPLQKLDCKKSRLQGSTPPGLLSEDDFVLRNSQCYNRMLAADEHDFHTPSQDSKEPLAVASLSNHTDHEPTASGSTQHGPGTLLLSTQCVGVEETTTPELETVGVSPSQEVDENEAKNEAHKPVQVFPIFVPKMQRKCVIIIRHGESVYNRMDSESRNWGDPKVYDAPLTARGDKQAQSLRLDLAEACAKREKQFGDALWVTSPLTRAMQTFLTACPYQSRLQRAANGANASTSAAGGHVSERPLRMVVLSTIAEHCATTGDIGRPRSTLVEEFPLLAGPLCELPEVWWFNPDPVSKPNCCKSRCFGKRETLDQLKHRVGEFSRWLQSRPEKFVVAFGHSTFWKHFSNNKIGMKNCDMMTMYF
eukprot:jgi/Chrzof1/1304/Cz10g02110.t1